MRFFKVLLKNYCRDIQTISAGTSKDGQGNVPDRAAISKKKIFVDFFAETAEKQSNFFLEDPYEEYPKGCVKNFLK